MRKAVPVNDAFLNDGHWYVLTSTSLGGSKLSPAEIADRLQSEDEEVMKDLLARGICLPLHFGCDCALDNAVFVFGDLSEREEDEWIGRIRSKLEIPCGELMLMGGGMEEDFEDALTNFEPPDKKFQYFQKFRLEPGTYLVEVYAFLGSYPVNEAWKEYEGEDFLETWWEESYPGEELPEWITFFQDEGFVDSEDFELVEHIIRIVPLKKQIKPPPLDEDSKWVGNFEMRRPPQCPLGLSRDEVLFDD